MLYVCKGESSNLSIGYLSTVMYLTIKEKQMKKLVEKKVKPVTDIVDVENEGLLALLGENVMLFCMNYIYAGKLIGVNHSCVLLEDPSIVYETGELCAKTFKDAQRLPSNIYIQVAAIESFGKSGR